MTLDNQNSSSQATETSSDNNNSSSQVTETSSQVTETSTENNDPELQAQESSSEIKKTVVIHLLLFIAYLIYHVFVLGTGISLQGIDPHYKSLNIILLISIVLFVLTFLISIKCCLTTNWKAKKRWRNFHDIIVLLLVMIILTSRATGV